MTDSRLPKKEHLTGEIRISDLFRNGEVFFNYPYRVFFVKHEHIEDPLVRVMFRVPKRRFKRAVDRNRMKRLMREAYRLNKSVLFEYVKNKNIALDVAFCVVCERLITFDVVNNEMQKTLNLLREKIA